MILIARIPVSVVGQQQSSYPNSPGCQLPDKEKVDWPGALETQRQTTIYCLLERLGFDLACPGVDGFALGLVGVEQHAVVMFQLV